MIDIVSWIFDIPWSICNWHRYDVYLILFEAYVIDIGMKYTWYYIKYIWLTSVWSILDIIWNIFDWHRYEVYLILFGSICDWHRNDVYLIFLEVYLIDIGMKYTWYYVKYMWLTMVWSILDIIWSICDWQRYEVYLILCKVYMIDIGMKYIFDIL